MNRATAPHTVYRLFDQYGVLLYVGSTSNFAQRLAAHRSTQPWADRIHTWTTEGPFVGVMASMARETAVMNAEGPLYSHTAQQAGYLGATATHTSRREAHAAGRECSWSNCRNARCLELRERERRAFGHVMRSVGRKAAIAWLISTEVAA